MISITKYSLNSTLGTNHHLQLDKIISLDNYDAFYNQANMLFRLFDPAASYAFYKGKKILSVDDEEREAANLAQGYVLLPSSVKTIGDNFFESSRFHTIFLPPFIESIGRNCFQNNYALLEVTIPKNLKTLGAGAFAFCFGLRSVNFEGKPESIGNAFTYCEKLKNIYVNWNEGEVEGAPWGVQDHNIKVHYLDKTVEYEGAEVGG